MSEIVLRINPDGSVLALSGSGVEEALDLRNFGKMTVTRASNVHFDETSQAWGWKAVDGQHSGAGFGTRLEAIGNEIEVLSAAL